MYKRQYTLNFQSYNCITNKLHIFHFHDEITSIPASFFPWFPDLIVIISICRGNVIASLGTCHYKWLTCQLRSRCSCVDVIEHPNGTSKKQDVTFWMPLHMTGHIDRYIKIYLILHSNSACVKLESSKAIISFYQRRWIFIFFVICLQSIPHCIINSFLLHLWYGIK